MNYNEKLLEDIHQGIQDLMIDFRKNFDLSLFSSAFEDAKETLKLSFGYKEGIELGKMESNYITFMTIVGVLSYYGILNNDVDIDKLKSRETADVNDIDFMFGFSEFKEIIGSFVEKIKGTTESIDIVSSRQESGLLSKAREITALDYISNSKYLDSDLKLIKLLGEKQTFEASEYIMNFITQTGDVYECDNYKTLIEKTLDNILSIYTCVLKESFGLKPYRGVFTDIIDDSNNYTKSISNTNKAVSIKGSNIQFEQIVNVILKGKGSNIVCKKNRQFDIKSIINRSTDAIQYYPLKILEYAMGRELTNALSVDVYRPHVNGNSWDKYADNYVSGQMRDFIIQAIYLSLEKNISFSESRNEKLKSLAKDKNFKFKNNDIFNDVLATDINAINFLLDNKRLFDLVVDDINFFQECVCTICCISKYASFSGELASIAIRVVDVMGKLNPTLTKSLYGNPSNKTDEFKDAMLLSEGVTTSKGHPLPYKVYEYSYEGNPLLANAEPLFGYKAIEMFKSRNEEISWNRILLGEDLKGASLFSGDKEGIKIQDKFIHNVIAGSRAGKGVQTMNLLGSAFASSKPVFYLDNKPDMAPLFYGLSGGSMFVINGGLFTNKHFPAFNDKSGSALTGWHDAYLKLPEEIRKEYYNKDAYEGDFGQMVYYRAVMLVLGIIYTRVLSAGSNLGVYNMLGGDNGIVAVFDEFRSWQSFESSFFGAKGKLGKNVRDPIAVKRFLTKNSLELTTSENELSSATTDRSKSSAEMKITLAQSERTERLKLIYAYATQIITKLSESFNLLYQLKEAGFKGKESTKSDIFLISQDFKNPYPDELTDCLYKTTVVEGNYLAGEDSLESVSLFRKFFESVDHDWFIGANIANDSSCNGIRGRIDADSRFKDYVNEKRSYWIYTSDSSLNSVTKLNFGEYKVFSPYLVLNNNKEHDPTDENSPAIIGRDEKGEPVLDPEYEYVAQCRLRVNKAAGNKDIWKYVRLNHVKNPENPAYGTLNDGVGFEGLISLINGGSFNPAATMGASGKMADGVARAMGYSGYKQLLFDLSPEGIFGIQDVSNALLNPSEYADKKKRLSVLDLFGYFSSDKPSNGGFAAGVDDGAFKMNFSEDSVSDSGAANNGFANSGASNNASPNSGASNTASPNSGASNNASPNSRASSDRLTDNERWILAEKYVKIYLAAAKSIDIGFYEKISHPNLNKCLMECMYDLIVKEGF